MMTIYFHGEAAADDALVAALAAEAADGAAVFGDLPGLCAVRPELVRQALAGATRILAPYSPRAIRWLIEFAGGDIAPDAALLDSRRAADWADVAARPEEDAIAAMHAEIAALDAPGEWRPWYPVIDRERCTACGQCVAFCLFGVYRQTGERVEVVAPVNCKNNCPACARACPHGAIVFPKSDESGIDGYPPAEGAAEGGRKLAGNILGQLRARGGAIPPEAAERLRQLDPDSDPEGTAR